MTAAERIDFAEKIIFNQKSVRATNNSGNRQTNIQIAPPNESGVVRADCRAGDDGGNVCGVASSCARTVRTGSSDA